MKGLTTMLLLIVIMTGARAQPQAVEDLPYTIEGSATMAPIISFFEQERYPDGATTPTVGFGGFLRLQWHPGRLITIGFHTGLAQLSKEELPTLIDEIDAPHTSATLTCVPLQVMVTMHGSRFEVGLGMGPYLMISTIQDEDVSQGTRLELGITAFAAYTFPISSTLAVGPEIRLLYFGYRGIFSMMPAITLTTQLFSY